MRRFSAPEEASPEDTSAQKVALTDAFMQMDADLSTVQAAVADCRATGNTAISQIWEPVDTQCHRTAEMYLSLIDNRYATPAEVEQGTDRLRAASADLATFKIRNSHALNTAAAQIAQIGTAARQAQDAAIRSLDLFGKLTDDLKAYRSVREAVDLLNQAVTQQRAAGTYPEIAAAAQQATVAAATLDAAVQAAPQLAVTATRDLGSVSTRIAAARTRCDDIKPAMSSLLREFPDGSSTDLKGNAAGARIHISQATDCLGRARSAERNGDPETVLTLITQARAELCAAEELADAVPDRLQLLRELREHPEKVAEKVRFTLHDAQMYADNHGITGQWGSVIDLQRKRVDRIVAELNIPYPDYWRYTNDLDEAHQFIRSVITDMRKDHP